MRSARMTDPYRRELQLHCYRILGSAQDAEDLVQETLLAAWRGLDQFRSGHRSARGCIGSRPTAASTPCGRQTTAATDDAQLPTPSRFGEPIWLQPYPDALLDAIADAAPGPDAR